jgi:hypothetical protein
MTKFITSRIAAVRVDVRRVFEVFVSGTVRRADNLGWALQERLDFDCRIRRNTDERRVRTVFQQTSDEIGEQILVSADRRVGSAGSLRPVFEKLAVKCLAHAVQTLEFVTRNALGAFNDRCDRQRIVGGKLRVDAWARGKQAFGTRHVIQIGHGLAREDGEIGEPTLLCAFDFAVPIGTLHEAHHELAIMTFRQRHHMLDHGNGALLVCLDREAEAIPSGK